MAERMICHYEILQVERDATDSDLKKAYRRQALVWHPDKNKHREEEATMHFQKLQAAYAILSDPNERAWYDNHREAILRGGSGIDSSEGVDLMPFFSPSCYHGFNDDKEGFFRVYGEVFHNIFKDEQHCGHEDMDEENHNFGTSKSEYSPNIKRFYDYWTGFVTARAFHTCDKWDLREAPNRRVKRLMEKDNKKERDKSRKEYQQTVRQLALFVKKRDPRVKAYKLQVKKEQVEKQEELEKQRQKEKTEQRRKADAYKESLEESGMGEELAKGLENLEKLADDVYGAESDDEEANVGTYCQVCRKPFKSKKQYENHQRSKKHLAAVARIQEEISLLEGDDTEEGEKDALSDDFLDEMLAAEMAEDEYGLDDDFLDQMMAADLTEENMDVSGMNITASSEGEDDDETSELEAMAAQFGLTKISRNNADETTTDVPTKDFELSKDAANDMTRDSGEENEENNEGSDADDILAAMMKKAKKTDKGDNTMNSHREDLSESDEEEHESSEDNGEMKAVFANPNNLDNANETNGATEADVGPDAQDGGGIVDVEHTEQEDEGQSKGRKKKGKRRKARTSEQETGEVCLACKESFPSKSKLFQHIKTTGHAKPLPVKEGERQDSDDDWGTKRKGKKKKNKKR